MTKKARLKKKLLMNIFLLGMAGLLYGIFVSYTGLAIPLSVPESDGDFVVSGLRCDGNVWALLHLNWKGFFFLSSGAVCCFHLRQYLSAVRRGMCRMADSGSPAGRISFLYVSVAALVIFGVVRNLVRFFVKKQAKNRFTEYLIVKSTHDLHIGFLY